jgi:hypothetical protein
MVDAERQYLERRAEDELDCAQHAIHPDAARAHYELLGFYLNRLYPETRQASGHLRLLRN